MRGRSFVLNELCKGDEESMSELYRDYIGLEDIVSVEWRIHRNECGS